MFKSGGGGGGGWGGGGGMGVTDRIKGSGGNKGCICEVDAPKKVGRDKPVCTRR